MISATLSAAMLVASSGEIELRFERLRNGRGSLHLCIMREATHFPDCGKDPKAIKRTIPAASDNQPVRFTDLPAGAYALTVLHDENTNGRLDTVLGIPREGFGFSRNPAVRFGPPRFDDVRFDVGEGITRLQVRMQYLL